MVCPYAKSEDGIEMQFATNHVGHFLLTNLLMGRILNGGGEGKRVVNVSSSAHRSGIMRWEDVNFEVCEFLPLKTEGADEMIGWEGV